MRYLCMCSNHLDHNKSEDIDFLNTMRQLVVLVEFMRPDTGNLGRLYDQLLFGARHKMALCVKL